MRLRVDLAHDRFLHDFEACMNERPSCVKGSSPRRRPDLSVSDASRIGRHRITIRGASSAVSPLSTFSCLANFRRATTAARRRSAYSHPAGERSESALYECSIRDCPDCLSGLAFLDRHQALDVLGQSKWSVVGYGCSSRRNSIEFEDSLRFQSCLAGEDKPSIRLTSIRSPTLMTLINGPSDAVTVSYTPSWSLMRDQ